MFNSSDPMTRHRRTAALVALIAVLVATFFVTREYKNYNQTYDEAAHLACGMEWLSKGTYNYETLHPPLARTATALLPYLAGERSQGRPQMIAEGDALLNYHQAYWKNLTLSRAGILPFFWLACFLVFQFMARRFGAWYGATAVVLLAFCPPVLTHAALATTDAPLMAMFTWSLLRFWAFLEKPDARNALLAGLAFSLAVLTKFTELPFFLLAAFFLFAYALVRARRFPVPVKLLILSILVVPPVLWAGYRFSFRPVFTAYSMGPSAEAKLKTLSPRERKLLTGVPVPAGEFLRGMIMVKGTTLIGRKSYLLGQVYTGGRPAFFPVALLVKTPIPMLLLAVLGTGALFAARRFKPDRSVTLLLLLGVACPLVVGITGQMNIGLRHVLPVYPFLAMLGAIAAGELWQARRSGITPVLRGAVLLLLGWEFVGCAVAEPNLLSYFNEAAAPHADHYLVNSDLDWGQSLFQLEDKLRQEHASSVSIDYFGDPDMDMSGLPDPHMLKQGDRPTGWIAVSETDYQEDSATFGWLSRYPYTLVGHSIRLYDLPALPPPQ